MKKTLIALMALAGVASAIDISGDVTISNTAGEGITTVSTATGLDIDYATYPNQIITTVGDVVNIYAVYFKTGTLGTENASLTLNIQGSLNVTDSFWLGSDSSFRTSITSTLSETEMQTLSSNGMVKRDLVTGVGHIKNFYADKVTFTLNGLPTSYQNGGLILERGGAYYNIEDVTFGNEGAMSIDTNTIREAELKANTYYMVVKMLDTETAGAGIKGLSLLVIPEPATATLSLLALAGLCARRRRA